MKKISIAFTTLFLVVTISGCSSQNHLIHHTGVMSASSHFTNPNRTSLKKDVVDGVVLFSNKRCTAKVNLNCLVEYARGDSDKVKSNYEDEDTFQASWARITIFY